MISTYQKDIDTNNKNKYKEKNMPYKSILKFGGLSVVLSSMLSAAIPATPGPYVGVYNVTDTSAHISFLDNATDEAGFKVYINNVNDVLDTTLPVNPIVVGAHEDSHPYQYAEITGLKNNTLYKLHVVAYNADGESASTAPSSENNGRIQTANSCKPAMPGEYVGTYNVTNTSARVSFLDNSDNEDGFKVYLYNYNTHELLNTQTLPAVSGIGDYQYANITGLTANTLYEVAVTAFSSECGESTPTHASSATNGRFRATNDSCPKMPGEYVGVYNVTSTGARVSFIDNSSNETGFHVYVYQANTLVKTITIDPKDGVGKYQYANIDGLEPNTLYTVKVTAFSNSCESSKTIPSSKTNGRFITKP